MHLDARMGLGTQKDGRARERGFEKRMLRVRKGGKRRGDTWSVGLAFREGLRGQVGAAAGGLRCQQKGLGSRSARWARGTAVKAPEHGRCGVKILQIGVSGATWTPQGDTDSRPGPGFPPNPPPHPQVASAAAAGMEPGRARGWICAPPPPPCVGPGHLAGPP